MSRKIKEIIIHHSATPRDQTLENSVASFDKNHWPNGRSIILHKTKNALNYYISYHYVIAWDGRYKKTRMWDEVGYHASNLKVNKESIWICLTWNFDIEKPSKAQYESLNKIIAEIKFAYPNATIHWHNEYVKKSCPWHNFDFTKLQEITMLFYEKLYKANYETIPQQKRIIKDLNAFFDRTNKLSEEQKRTETVYLLAWAIEKLSSKKDVA